MSPVAPGTAGSLAAILVLSLLFAAIHHYAPPAQIYPLWQAALLLGLLTSCIFSVYLGPWAIHHYQCDDPSCFVLDEVAGICLSLFALPMYNGWTQLIVLFVAFTLFRLFDILKPPPVRQLERLPLGWGILMDDLAAGVYANILGQILIRSLNL